MLTACVTGTMYTLDGKHALITGGAAGIGLALTKACLQRGAAVSIVDIVSDTSAARDELDRSRQISATASVVFIRADVGAYDQV